MVNRRWMGSALASGMLGFTGLVPTNSWAEWRDGAAQERFRALEVRAHGRLGVYVLDVASGQGWGYRADERFMMLSSFKLLASALVLARVDAGQESLARRIAYRKSDLVAWSPVTERHADGEGLTLAQLCEATITTSDNTAANLILTSYGGPKAVTAFARKLGDQVTRLDRNEPALNTPAASEPWDTTSPRAMATTLHTLLLGDALSPSSRQLLQQWLLANTTGGKRLKAGVPSSWKVGDKTGTNATDANDIGILLPPHRAPWLVTAYLANSTESGPVKEETLAAVAQWVASL